MKTRNSQGIRASQHTLSTVRLARSAERQMEGMVTNPSQEMGLYKDRQAARLVLWGFADYPSRLLCKNKALLR